MVRLIRIAKLYKASQNKSKQDKEKDIYAEVIKKQMEKFQILARHQDQSKKASILQVNAEDPNDDESQSPEKQQLNFGIKSPKY